MSKNDKTKIQIKDMINKMSICDAHSTMPFVSTIPTMVLNEDETQPEQEEEETKRPKEAEKRYIDMGLIGKGGMGEVFRARHMEESWAKRQGGDVALKIMRPRFAKDPAFRKQVEDKIARSTAI